jgi:hypothetical protein
VIFGDLARQIGDQLGFIPGVLRVGHPRREGLSSRRRYRR